MSHQKIHTAVGLLAVILSSAFADPSDGPSDYNKWFTDMLNAQLSHMNEGIDKEIPDPLDVHFGKNLDKHGGCCKKWGTCWCCRWSYDYSVSFGTIGGLNKLQIQKFYNVNMTAGLFSGELSVALIPMEVYLDNGKAGAGLMYCGAKAKAGGRAHAKVSFTADGNFRIEGKQEGDCFRFTLLAGSRLNIRHLKIHDTHVQLKIDSIKFPTMKVQWLVDLITGLVPEVTGAIEKAVSKALEPALAKELGGKCIKFPGSAHAKESAEAKAKLPSGLPPAPLVLQVDDGDSTEFRRPRRPRRTHN